MEAILDSAGKWRKCLLSCVLPLNLVPMFTLGLFILLVYLNAHTDSQDLQVINSGVTSLQKNDMVMMFFVTVKHFGRHPRRAMAAPIECCERVAEGDQDCDLIDLFGGDYGLIQPGSVANFTLIYPTLYGYNRRGYCMVKILHRDMGLSDVSEVHHRIDFDTTLSSIPRTLMSFSDPDSQPLCETPDLDPLDHCNPVDCYLKYAGYRNFYNRNAKMCQRVPVCETDLDKDLPDIVYVPTSNTCWDLEKSVQKEDIEQLSQGFFKSPFDQMVNIRCHHGEIDPRTGLCVCDYGWKSEPFNPETVNSGQSFYSMCTIKCHWDDPYKYLPFWVGIILGMWLLFFVSLCEWNNVFLVRRAQNRASRDTTETLYSYKGCDSPQTIELSCSSNAVVGTKNSLQQTSESRRKVQ